MRNESRHRIARPGSGSDPFAKAARRVGDCSKLPDQRDVAEGVTRRIEPLMNADGPTAQKGMAWGWSHAWVYVPQIPFAHRMGEGGTK